MSSPPATRQVAQLTRYKEFDAKQKQLDARQTELKTLKDELDAQSTMMTQEKKQEKVVEITNVLMNDITPASVSAINRTIGTTGLRIDHAEMLLKFMGEIRFR